VRQLRDDCAHPALSVNQLARAAARAPLSNQTPRPVVRTAEADHALRHHQQMKKRLEKRGEPLFLGGSSWEKTVFLISLIHLPRFFYFWTFFLAQDFLVKKE
jgi:hypothetical protein